MATNPSGSDIQLEINSYNNNSGILSVNGRYAVCTTGTRQIRISGCSTATGGNAILYFMTRTNYGSSTSTNIFNAGNYDARTFNTNSTRQLLGSNTSGDIYNYATPLGTAFNGGGSDRYYIYAVNLDASFTWSNFVRCTFSNSISGVSSYYFTVTWTNAIRTVTISGATSNIPANSSTNWDSAYGAIVLSSGDAGYALDLSLSGSSGEHNNIWYATPYTTNVNSTTNPFSAGSDVGRTHGTSTNPGRLEPTSSTNEVTSIPTEGHANSYRLWGRIYHSGLGLSPSQNPYLTDGKYYDGYYYNGGIFTACHPDTGVTVPSGTISIASSATQADVTVSGISSSDQNGFQWRYNGAASGTSGAGSITPTSSNIPITTNLPAAGTSRTFGLFVKNFSTNSNSTALHSDWIDTGKTVTVSRQASSSYSVSASSSSINEGQSVTFTVTTTNVANNTTVNYTISGIVAADISAGSLTGTLTIANNTASTSITLDNDTLTEGSETATFTLAATDSEDAATGSPSTSVTIADTSTQPGGGSSASLSGGVGSAYGLQIKNQAGTQTILDDTSRIGSSLASGSITFTNSNTSGTLFSGFNCSSVATTGFIVSWTGNAWAAPTITRSTNGITVTRTGAANGTVTVYLIRY